MGVYAQLGHVMSYYIQATCMHISHCRLVMDWSSWIRWYPWLSALRMAPTSHVWHYGCRYVAQLHHWSWCVISPFSLSPSLFLLPCLQTHPSESLLLAKSLYHDFCVLLPDAMEPLLRLPAVSPHMAYQMTQAFTTLHPFHIGKY